MAKQEEIREGMDWVSALARIIIESTLVPPETPYWLIVKLARDILKYQTSKGMVIKVDKELPTCAYWSYRDIATDPKVVAMLKAGYVAVEPLIKETK